MSITRMEFCGVTAAGTGLVLMPACGGGGSETPQTAEPSCGASGTAISLNHGHLLVIATVDLDSMVDMTYGSRGSADHDHTVTFTVAQLRQLKAGRTITADASVSAAHAHVMTVTCMG